MVQRVSTVAFEGIEARAVDVQIPAAILGDALNNFTNQNLPSLSVGGANGSQGSAVMTPEN
jgi:hypothetical protein